MNIAILYIGTGKYSNFWKGFYDSSEKHFLTTENKHYFVFTDDINIKESKNVTIHSRKCKGFPLDSLFRFEMFWSIKNELSRFDYIFFFNANMLFVDFVGNEVLPTDTNDGLVALIHPGHYRKSARLLPYERNKKSLAYIPHKKQKYFYYQGCLNGGTSKDYLELIKTCMANTQIDYEKGIIARVHDESHLNKYLFEKKVLGLNPSYGYPEDWDLPFPKKILQLNKFKHIPNINKGINENFFRKWIRRAKSLGRIIYWFD